MDILHAVRLTTDNITCGFVQSTGLPNLVYTAVTRKQLSSARGA